MTRHLSLILAGCYLGICLGLIVGGCHMAATSSTATVQRAADINGGVRVESKSIRDNANGVKHETEATRKETPPAALPVVAPHMAAIDNHADAILVSAGKLDDLAGQLKQLQDSIAAEQQAHAKETADLKAEIAKEKSELQHKLNGLTIAAIGLFGLLVAVAVIVHDYTYAVAGGAGCGAVILAALVTGVAAKLAMWIAGAVIAAALIWVGITWYKKKNLAAALKSDWQSPVVQRAATYADSLVKQLVAQMASPAGLSTGFTAAPGTPATPDKAVQTP